MVLKLKVLIQILQENSEKVYFCNGFQRGSFIWCPFLSSVLWLYMRILRLCRSSDFRIFFSGKYKFSKILYFKFCSISYRYLVEWMLKSEIVIFRCNSLSFCAIAAKLIYLFEVYWNICGKKLNSLHTYIFTNFLISYCYIVGVCWNSSLGKYFLLPLYRLFLL